MNTFIRLKLKFYACILVLSILPALVFAESNKDELGAGKVARTMLEPLGVMSDFINTLCFVIGGSFLFASIIKYIEYRRSPLMVPFSTVFYLFLIGLILVLLPFISMITESGITYSLLR